MLLYEYGVRDKIDAIAEYAWNTLAKFESGTAAAVLLLDAKALESQYKSL